MKLSHLAEKVGLSVVGDKNFEVDDIAYADEAEENDLAVAFSEKDILTTKAKVVLTEPRIVFADKIFVYCIYGGIMSTMVDIANLFVMAGLSKNYNIPSQCESKDFQVGLNTIIEPFVTIGDGVNIGDNCLIESNVFIGSGTVLGDNCVIHSGARIGAASFLHYDRDGEAQSFFGIGRTILKSGVQVGYNSVVQRGTLSDTVIGERTLIGNLVVIAHDVKIGSDSHIVCQSGIAARAKIGSHVKILAQSGVVDNVQIANNVTLLSKSVATKNIRCGKMISGLYGREHREELKAQALLRRLKRE